MRIPSANSNRNKRHRANKTSLFLLLFSIFYFLFSVFSTWAEARIYIQIDQPSEKKFPIAVANGTGGSGGWNKKVSEIIRKDLTLTNLFEIIPPDEFPKGALEPVSYPAWTLIGAQALVTARYAEGRGVVHAEFVLHDPAIGQPLTRKTYTAGGKDISVVAHHFADEIMKELTGEAGVFSSRIAYTQVAGKRKKEIGVMDMDGLNAGVITKDKTINLSPAWSPGGQIAYSTLTKGGEWHIAVPGRRITSNGSINISPAFSPGGTLTVASAMSGDTEIYLMNMSGGIIDRLTQSYGIDVNQSWSPDGSSFVFASERAGRLHLFKSGAGGGGVERLTFVGSQNDNPSWSPKGDKIAFQSLSGGWDIFIMNADGSNIQRLTSTGNCESPTWAPNGRFIAASCGGQVHLMREDGTNLTPVGPKGSLQPAWGPMVK